MGEQPAAMELVRLAFPRRTYTQSHIDYVAEVVIEVAARARELRGLRIASAPPWLLHFTARFEELRARRRGAARLRHCRTRRSASSVSRTRSWFCSFWRTTSRSPQNPIAVCSSSHELGLTAWRSMSMS